IFIYLDQKDNNRYYNCVMSRKLYQASKKRSRPVDENIKEYKQKLLRLQADFDNFRKRSQDEKDQIRQNAKADSLLEIVPVLDNFERSLKHIPKELESSDWVVGITYIHKQLTDILSCSGLKKIDTKNTKFNAVLHEAISYEASKKHSKDQIIDEVESGYKFGDQIIKPAKVRVAK
ncbi:MAG: nucleotide exchange factor GrpE, partial [bacterium]